MPEGATIESLSGRVLEGRFRLDAPLGEGGLGVVWRGFHVRLGKPVAIKLMHREHLVREGLRQRFEREARSLAALSHPNIVDVIDFGVDDDLPYLVMELLEGRSLDRAIHDGLAPDRALAIGRDVLRALAHAHAKGIVHRDLKPANVFLQRLSDGSEVVRVLDFGLAKFVVGSADEPQLTRQGMVLGTPAYMAPEQAMGGSADARADVYAFGIVLFEMLTGRRPFEGEGGELVRQHLLVSMPTIASMRPDLVVAPELDDVLARATAKTPAERYATALQLMEALVALPSPTFTARSDGAALAPISRNAAETRRPPRPAPDSSEQKTSVPAIDGRSAAATSGGATNGGAVADTFRESPMLAHSDPRADTRPMPEAAGAIPPTDRMPSPVRGSGAVMPVASHADATRRSGAPSLGGGASQGGETLGAQRLVAPRWGLILGVGAAGLLIVGVLVAVTVAWSMGSAETASPTPTPPATTPAAVTAPDPEPVEPADTAPDVDPWRADDVPPQLARLYERVSEEHELSQSDIGWLRRYANQHDDDPRPCLVLGHANVLRGARTEAVDNYEAALVRDDHAARGDPLTLSNLLELVAYDHPTSDAAAHLIWNFWGPRARSAVDQHIGFERDERLRARLERLRAALEPGGADPALRR